MHLESTVACGLALQQLVRLLVSQRTRWRCHGISRCLKRHSAGRCSWRARGRRSAGSRMYCRTARSQRAGSSSLPRAAGSRRIWAGSRRYHRTTHLAGPARVETSLMRTPQRDSCTRAPPREDKTSTSICVYCYSRVFFSCHCLTVAIHPFPSPAGTKNPHPDSLGSATAKRKQSIRKGLEITSNGSLLVMISQATARLLVDVP